MNRERGDVGRELRRRVKRAGSHYFDRETMSFFRSWLHAETITGADYGRGLRPWEGRRVYFVTSEQFDDDAPRLYSVRVAVFQDTGDGERVDVGDAEGHTFQEYSTLGAAAVALGRTVAAWNAGEVEP